MMIQGAAHSKESWPAQKPKDPNSASEVNRIKMQIEKDSQEISDLAKEMAEIAAKGDKDLAGLKNVEIQQKQLSIQSLRMQMDKLQQPQNSTQTVTQTQKTEEGTGASFLQNQEIPPRPATVADWSQLAQSMLHSEE